MKGVLVVLDGLGDLPHTRLEGKTPLEAANKPFLDEIAGNSKIGYMYPINEKYIPESDKALLHILGREKTIVSRGQLEAIGAGIELNNGDLALRANFGTITDLEEKKIVDRRAGRTLIKKEALILADAINKGVKLEHPFIFKPTVQHRGVLVLRGSFSDCISNTDSAYSKSDKHAGEFMNYAEPLDESDLAEYTAGQVNSFVKQSYEILQKHKINQKRKLRGELAANIILMRGPGSTSLKVDKFKSWASVSYMPLEIGIAKTFGMQVFSFDYNLKNYKTYDFFKNLLKKAAKFSIKIIKKNSKKFDYFYIHLKETDLPGHDNLPLEKKEMIEILDRYFFYYLLKMVKKAKFKVIVTGDHATPCIKSSHSADPVPFLVLDEYKETKKVNFCEKTAMQGEKIYGRELLNKAGFV